MASGSGVDSSADIENGKERLSLAELIEKRNSKLRPTSEWCIYRVPNRLRRVKKTAYTPLVVSIGPLHHGGQDLIAMEEHKWRFLRLFLNTTKVALTQYIALVMSKENKIRDYYADFISFPSDKFVDLILLDAVFIIEIMLILHNRHDFRNMENNPFFDKPWIICQYILPDLRLLENQIPFFIIKKIYERAQKGGVTFGISIDDLCQKFLKDYLFVLMKPNEHWNVCIGEMKHFVDGLRQLCKPPGFMNNFRVRLEENVADQIINESFTIPTVTELHQAGIRFEAVTTNMFDIRFEGGVLKIPKITLNNKTKILLRNIIAFEQHHCKDLVISNFVLVTRLIDTNKDLDLLIEYGIINRAIGDHKNVLMRIKTLAHEVAMDRVDFLFYELCEDLKNHCKDPRHKWLANLKQIYFNTPWTTISMIVATILLLLTFTQTVFSVLSFIFKR